MFAGTDRYAGPVPSSVTARTVVAPVFGTNCYVVGADGGPCIVVDAGAGVASGVREVVAQHHLQPVAVLATHGHVDHTWDAAELSEAFGVPVVLHESDAYRLGDPFGTLGLGGSHDVAGPLAQALRSFGIDPSAYRVPGEVETFSTVGGEPVDLGLDGLSVRALHAPGHTQGSTLYLVEIDGEPAVLSGDVLFAGTIGRTDLPGGDGVTMAATLRDVVLGLDPSARVLPGHGPETRLDLERRRNPYLAH